MISSFEKSPALAEKLPISVSTQPGFIVLTVIPYSASSKASALEAPVKPAFVAEYIAAFASPTTPLIEPMLIILPKLFCLRFNSPQ